MASSAKITLDDKNFRSMMNTLRVKSPIKYKELAEMLAAAVIQSAANKTKKSKLKKIKEDVLKSLRTVGFRSSSGNQIRMARNGNMIYRDTNFPGGKWIPIKNDFNLRSIGSKNPAMGRKMERKLQSRINKTISEARTDMAKRVAYKKKTIAAGQATFLHLMKQAHLKPSAKGLGRLGPATKALLTKSHKSVLSAKRVKTKEEHYIIIRSKSRTALNRYAGGINAFRDAIFGQKKQIERMTGKKYKEFVKSLGDRYGFITK